jgi:NAD(P)-dependent dehydrogenase (short-subunit alcohol dehydrogenase family)
VRELRGKVAVVTGGGSGIGAALARACAAEGMAVVAADVDLAAAEAVAGEVRARGTRALAAAVDVRERASLDALAARTYRELGACHLLCNNAGVVLFRPLAETTERDFAWLLGVNALGVFHGVAAFLPRMRAQGGEAHVLNTASMAGLVAIGAMPVGAYTASKFAVVGYSEMLREELAPDGIGVTLLCPGGVATRIGESERSRPPELHDAAPPPSRALGAGDDGILAPEAVAACALDAVRANAPYAVTHPDWWPFVEARFEALRAAFAAAGAPGGARTAASP